jgi:hypothetical protein
MPIVECSTLFIQSVQVWQVYIGLTHIYSDHGRGTLFTQARVAANSGLFLEGLPGNERRALSAAEAGSSRYPETRGDMPVSKPWLKV